MIFVGYEARSNAYMMYNPVDGRVNITRDAVFDEAAQWSWDQDVAESINDGDTFTMEYSTRQPTMAGEAAGGSPVVSNSLPTVADSGGGAALGMAPISPASPTTSRTAAPERIDFTTPPELMEELVDAEYDVGDPVRFRIVDSVLGAASPPGLAPRVLDSGDLLFTTAEEPTTFKEAE